MKTPESTKLLFNDLKEYISKSGIAITTIISVLLSLIALINQVSINEAIIRFTLLILVTIFISLACIFLLIISKKKEPSIIDLIINGGKAGYETRESYKYSKKFRRNSVLVAIILLFVWITFLLLMTRTFTDNTVIIIGKISENNCAEKAITQKVEAKLSELKQQRSFITLLLSENSINGDNEAVKHLNNGDSFLVIYGFCSKDLDKINGRVNLKSNYIFITKSNENYDDFITKPIEYNQGMDNSDFSTITKITNEISFRVAIALGFKLYDEKKFEETIYFLDKAEKLSQDSINQDMTETVYSTTMDKLYFYRGKANFELGKSEEALKDFKLAILKGRKKDSSLYYLLASSHLNLLSQSNQRSFSHEEEEKYISCSVRQFREAYNSNQNEEYLSKCNYSFKRFLEIKKINEKELIENENCQNTLRLQYDEKFCELPN